MKKYLILSIFSIAAIIMPILVIADAVVEDSPPEQKTYMPGEYVPYSDYPEPEWQGTVIEPYDTDKQTVLPVKDEFTKHPFEQ